ncbi:hypothetical protein Tco_0780829 [Tanacetum coccineum]
METRGFNARRKESDSGITLRIREASTRNSPSEEKTWQDQAIYSKDGTLRRRLLELQECVDAITSQKDGRIAEADA